MSRSHRAPVSRQGRSQAAQPRAKRSWLPIVLVVVLFVGGLAALSFRPNAKSATGPVQAAQSAASTEAPRAKPAVQQKAGAASSADRTVVQAENGLVRVALTDLVGEEAHFYTYQAKSKTIPFFVMRSSDGVVRAAFDACDVCFTAKKGYHQEGDEMVCNNCGSRFPSTKINEVKGGCNPSPLERIEQGDNLVIKVGDLEAGAKYF